MDEDLIIARLSALAHPIRLRAYIVISAAGAEGLGAGRIAERLGVRPNVLTPHLASLVGCGLLNREDRGTRANFNSDRTAAADVGDALAEILSK